MGDVIGGWNDADAQRDVYELLFDDVNHLGLNFARYNIGGGQAPNLSIPRPGAEIDGWVPNQPSNPSDSSTWQYDWSADATQRSFLDEAIARGVVEVEAYANSAPWWMTISGDVTGAPSYGQDNLDPADYAVFAEYLTTVSRHFEDNLSVRFGALAPMNEPGAGWWTSPGAQEGMNVSKGANQSALLLATRDALVAKGLQSRLVAPEETSSCESLNSFLRLSSAAMAAVDQINTHTYPFLSGTSPGSLNALQLQASGSDKRLYVSEYGTGGGDGLAGGLTLASRISTDIKQSGAGGWTYWQAVEDNNGSGWGLLISPFGESEDYSIRTQYAVMQQFTSFIRAGSYVLDVGDDNVLAAYNPELDATVVVMTNTASQSVPQEFTFTDQQVYGARVIRTDDNGVYRSNSQYSVTGQSVGLTTSGESVTTLLVHHRPNLLSNETLASSGQSLPATSLAGGWQTQGDARFYDFIDNGGDGSGAGVLWTDGVSNAGVVRQDGVAFEADQAGMAFQLSIDVLFQNSDSAGQDYDASTKIGMEFLGRDGKTLAHDSELDYVTQIDPIYNDSQYRLFRSEAFEAPEGTWYVRPVIRFDGVGAVSTDWTYFDNVRLQSVGKIHRGRFYREGAWSEFESWEWDADVTRDDDLVFSDFSEVGLATVTQNSTASNLTFDRSGGMAIEGTGELRLITDGERSMVDVRTAQNSIAAPLVVGGDTLFRVLPGASLTLSGNLDAGGRAMEKTGDGELQVGGDLALSGGHLELSLTGSARLIVNGQVTLDGTLTIDAGPGSQLDKGQQFTVLEYASLATAAGQLVLPELPADADWKVCYLANGLQLQVIDAVLPGDYNGDNVVNAADYTVWRDQLGTLGAAVSADGNEDGVVDHRDYAVWVTGFAAAVVPVISVPEPIGLRTGAIGLVLSIIRGDLWRVGSFDHGSEGPKPSSSTVPGDLPGRPRNEMR